MQQNKLKSLSIFFPFYNDEGTVERQITNAYKVGKSLAEEVEVIAINGGASKDNTFGKIQEMKEKFPDLVIVNKQDNWEGYAVIKYGFTAATKEWIFYTDGDAQYHLEEDLQQLVRKALETGADVINGYKKTRRDNFIRTFFGKIYTYASTFAFELPIRDTDCDFRLIKKSLMNRITLECHDAAILPELIKKLQLEGAKFVEVPVSHYRRDYGTSNYTAWSLLKEKVIGDIKLYIRMRKIRPTEHKQRILRFGLVGIISIGIQALIFNLLSGLTPLAPTLNAILADQVAILNSFYWNNRFTFKETFIFSPYMLRKFLKFYGVVIISTFIQALTVFIGTFFFGRGFVASNVFFFLGTGLAFIWNYSIQSRVIWKKESN
ncbi:MAG TPA: bifunctional glycosyltransferase family 2/GtrA family protein [bacterium]|nr:bifunctional glycosyltransferase family 2/GtrA family protein [bacterium]